MQHICNQELVIWHEYVCHLNFEVPEKLDLFSISIFRSYHVVWCVIYGGIYLKYNNTKVLDNTIILEFIQHWRNDVLKKNELILMYLHNYDYIFVKILNKGVLEVTISFTRIFFCSDVFYKCCSRYLLRIQQWRSVIFHFCCCCQFFCFFSMTSFEARQE